MTERRAKPKRRANRATVLDGHRRDGKRFTPPMMQFPMTPVSWFQDMLPDFLWLSVMLGRRSDWRAAYRPLSIMDQFVPDGKRIADGRLSSFALVPESCREEARECLRRETPHALPSALAHALGLFPGCPAGWLFEDMRAHQAPDADIGLPLLRTFVEENADKTAVSSTRLRMAAISRLVTHGKISHSGDSTMQLVPRYPHGLNEQEQRTVESVMRAMWHALCGTDEEGSHEAGVWAAAFWTRARDLTACKINATETEVPVVAHENGPLDPEPIVEVAEIRALLTAARTLGDNLREAQLAAVTSPDNDPATAVLLGMASRMYRLLLDFLDRPSCWAPATASFYLRPLAETRIVSAWLASRNDPELIAAYREHGLGNLKLLRDHVRADVGEDADGEMHQALEAMDQRVNLEVDEWFQPVNVGAFTKTTIRDMAIECDLKRVYDLMFAPMSSMNHGEWPAVRDYDTTVCAEPLHRGHRVGAFVNAPHIIGPDGAAGALQLAEDGIGRIFELYSIDVSAHFEPVWESFNVAMYSAED